MPDELLALGTGVGEGVVVAGNAVGAAVCLDVFAAVQGLIAFCTVKCLAHGGSAQRALLERWDRVHLEGL